MARAHRPQSRQTTSAARSLRRGPRTTAGSSWAHLTTACPPRWVLLWTGPQQRLSSTFGEAAPPTHSTYFHAPPLFRSRALPRCQVGQPKCASAAHPPPSTRVGALARQIWPGDEPARRTARTPCIHCISPHVHRICIAGAPRLRCQACVLHVRCMPAARMLHANCQAMNLPVDRPCRLSFADASTEELARLLTLHDELVRVE